MRISMIGTGYVGLVSGVCFAEFGYHVNCVDQNHGIIDRLNGGELTIYEPGLEDLLRKNVAEGRLTFTTDLAAAVAESDVVFIAVGTPSRRGDGEADLQYIFAAAEAIALAMRPNTTVVIKSTATVGTAAAVAERIAAARPDVPFSMVSNPEFLREGSAVEDFMRPDRVVVGARDDNGRAVMQRVYRPLYLRETPLVVTSLENAELIKYASNAFLAMKVTFINQLADLCERVGGNVQDVAKAIGMDRRIGSKFLHPGPGFGGSCFPKDTRAFAAIGRRFEAPQRLVETVVAENEQRKKRMGERILSFLAEPAAATVAVLGVSFKPNTDDIREAPSLDIIAALTAAGVTVRAHDPAAMAAASRALDGVAWCGSPYQAAEGADAVALLTDWNAYRALDLTRIAGLMRGRIFFDARNVYQPADLTDTGLAYHSVGRPPIG
ncbi:UDP-glucose/GDP-mannose dehydrogenase family protein [Aquibium sp. A9E412]|uniref:UDP-glucose dehydrogenase family protein n=1 Tax=Aquibium sp. A9E412 TaxID=2976767 RepID=UPI0025AF3E33|nr:UDP-glucose/GDP-mannose dehydrogenase family protein [Aquibium sp. A9E412]MDN2566078.1 UDP-glucose/GDP-mannose dehydrogenase family protein [Aquibium sp. A9E412]